MQTRASCALKSSRSRNWIGCVATSGSPSSAARSAVAATRNSCCGCPGAALRGRRRREKLAQRRALSSLLVIALQQRFADIAGSGTRERDQPVDADFLQHPAADLGPAAHARRQVGARQQLAKLQIALRERQSSSSAIGTIGVGLVGNEDIAAEQRLDSLAARRRVELDQAEDIARSVSASAGMPSAGGARDGIIETDDAVGDRVLAVQAKVDERGFRHARHFTPRFSRSRRAVRRPGAAIGPARKAACPARPGVAAQLLTQSMIGCHCSRSFAARDAERSNIVMPCIVVCT
jgi:hypothetical protein